jgi:putative ABC transport system permease protein
MVGSKLITYLLVRDKKDIPLLQQQIAGYMKTSEVRTEAKLEGNAYLTYHLEPLKTVHLRSSLAGFEPNGNMTYIYMFGIIAILILIIASANYTNLATAQSTGRGNEIGMRKVLGASKKQYSFSSLVSQLLLLFFSAALALALSIFLIPYFNSITGKEFTSEILLQPVPIISLALFAIVVSFLAGFYPAMILSGTKALGVLKKGFRITGGSGALRKSLIVIQFSISVFLIIYTAIFAANEFYKTKNLGYDKDILVLPIAGKMSKDFQNIKDAIAQVPGVEGDCCL